MHAEKQVVQKRDNFMDVLTKEQRRKNMRNIRGRGTKPERFLARTLHAHGFRYRLNVASLPGSPDLVFPKYRVVIFVHGCCWHGHDCHLFKVPATRQDFWLNKINKTKARDAYAIEALMDHGWRVMVVWECAIKGRSKRPVGQILKSCEAFLRGDDAQLETRGLPLP